MKNNKYKDHIFCSLLLFALDFMCVFSFLECVFFRGGGWRCTLKLMHLDNVGDDLT